MSPKQLLQMRRDLGLTQVGFAEMIGVAPNTVARWERAEIGIKPTTARLIKLLVEQRRQQPRKGKKR